MQEYKISILMPSYNQAKYIGETIESILNQDYRNFEIILIDGGSTDGTLDVIKRYESDIAYWVSEPDQGQTHALNKAYQIATGDIIGWQNSDDLYEKGAFKTAIESFNKYKDVDIIYGNYRLVDEASKLVKNYYAIDFDINTRLYENSIVYNQAMFWKKSFSDAMMLSEFNGPFNECLKFVMDAEFIFRAYLHGAKFKRVGAFFGAFRMQPENKTTLMEDVFLVEYDSIRNELFPDYSKVKERLLKYPLKLKRLALSTLYRIKGELL